MAAVPINYWAVLVAVIVNVALGFAWYGPIFGKKWLALMGISPEQAEEGRRKGMGASTIIIMLVGTFFTVFVLKHNIVFGSAYLGMTGVAAGLQAGFWNWLGFVAPVTLSSVLWERKSWSLWILNNGYYLVAYLIVGVILSCWI